MTTSPTTTSPTTTSPTTTSPTTTSPTASGSSPYKEPVEYIGQRRAQIKKRVDISLTLALWGCIFAVPTSLLLYGRLHNDHAWFEVNPTMQVVFWACTLLACVLGKVIQPGATHLYITNKEGLKQPSSQERKKPVSWQLSFRISKSEYLIENHDGDNVKKPVEYPDDSDYCKYYGVDAKDTKVAKAILKHRSKVERFDKQGMQLILLLGGVLFIFAQIVYQEYHNNETGILLRELCRDIGISLLVAGLVSMVFDVSYHETVFGKPLQNLRESSTQVKEALNEYSFLLGFDRYRSRVKEAFRDADERVISIASYWWIDDDWWVKFKQEREKTPDNSWKSSSVFKDLWKASNVFDELTKSKQDGSVRAPIKNIVFAGKTPWLTGEGFAEEDFDRFLGVIWRYMLGHYLRQHWRSNGYNDQDFSVSVVVANFPMPITIVDNEVFLLLEEKKDVKESRGRWLTEQVKDDAKKAYTDTHVHMINQYLHHTRSVREYIQSVMIYMSRETGNAWDTKTINLLLTGLGVDKWAEWRVQGRSVALGKVGQSDYKDAAYLIIREFVDSLSYKSVFDGETIDLSPIRKDLY